MNPDLYRRTTEYCSHWKILPEPNHLYKRESTIDRKERSRYIALRNNENELKTTEYAVCQG